MTQTVTRWGFIVLMCSLLMACANPVLRSDVLSFHQWPANSTERSYTLKRLSAQEGSLEHAAYEALLRAELNAAGFTESKTSRYAITVEYSQQSRVHRIYEPPIVFGSVIGWGGGFYRPGWGVSYGVPIGPAYPGYGRDYPIYSRTVKLVINDLKNDGAPRVWEGTASSSGSAPDLATVLPFMFRALLADFPGQSGITRRVDVELPKVN